MDTVSPERRSEIMALVKGKNTKPEVAVRKLVHGMGYRFRLHRRDLPGSPDMVFPARRKVIFIHGCFWHRHEGCEFARMPKSREAFWQQKFEANTQRDARNERALRKGGWGVMTVWECQVFDVEGLTKRIRRFLDA